MNMEKGWKPGDYNYDFEDAFECAADIYIIYEGHRYEISLEEDQNVYDCETHEIIMHYESEEDFYNSTLFGRPIKDVIDDSYILEVG